MGFRDYRVCGENIGIMEKKMETTISGLGFRVRWTPHPVIVTIMDNKDYIRGPLIFLFYHYYRVGGPPNVV